MIDKETNRDYLEKEGTTEKGSHCKRVTGGGIM